MFLHHHYERVTVDALYRVAVVMAVAAEVEVEGHQCGFKLKESPPQQRPHRPTTTRTPLRPLLLRVALLLPLR